MSFRDAALDNESMYFKAKDGQNKVRIISEETAVWTQFNKETNKALKFLDEATVKEHLKTLPDNKDKGIQTKKQYAFWVIDRADGKVKIMEAGAMIMSQIQSLAKDEDYGFDTLPNYDIKIGKTGTGLETQYDVRNSPASELTDAERAIVMGLESVADFLKKQPGMVEAKPLTDDQGNNIPF